MDQKDGGYLRSILLTGKERYLSKKAAAKGTESDWISSAVKYVDSLEERFQNGRAAASVEKIVNRLDEKIDEILFLAGKSRQNIGAWALSILNAIGLETVQQSNANLKFANEKYENLISLVSELEAAKTIVDAELIFKNREVEKINTQNASLEAENKNLQLKLKNLRIQIPHLHNAKVYIDNKNNKTMFIRLVALMVVLMSISYVQKTKAQRPVRRLLQ